MKRLTRKLFSMIMVFAITILNFLPMIKVYADPEPNNNQNQIIRFRLDDATVSDSVITFTSGNVVAEVTVVGTGYSFDGTDLIVELEHINDVKLALGNGFERDRMSLKLHDQQTLVITGDNEAIFGGLDFTKDNAPHLGLYLDNNNNGEHGGDNTQNHQGNGTATLNYSVNGAIEYTSGGGYDNGITFRINGTPYDMPDPNRDDFEERYADFLDDNESEKNYVQQETPAYERDGHGQYIENENGEYIPILDPDTMQQMTEITGYAITGDTINYDYDTTTNKVGFTFTMAPGTLMTSLRINGVEVNTLPKTAAELEHCYIDHRLEINVDDIDVADTYIIQIEARYPNEEEEFMGNFLWDYNPEGYTGPDDKILNATMTFVSAEYDGHIYTTEEEINALHGVYNWKNAERKKNYTSDWEGVGEAQFPKGTILTVKIIPDAGYQLIDFGINGGVFEPQDEIGTYTFEVQGGPFHLQATVAQVEDVVKTRSEKIESGRIVLDEEESMAVGTARLDVSDIDLTDEQISNFKEATEGYSINNYVDISLFNTVFKGSENQSWDTEVKDLENDATITLKLEEGVKGDEVVIVHEKHDGTYEIIPVDYDAETNTITFKTKSFSNYAIATKDSVESVSQNETKIPKTYDGIIKWIIMLIISIIGLLFGILKFKKSQSI